MRLAAPLIIAAHVEHLPTLPGWDGVRVFEGGGTTREGVRRWATIGYVAGDTGPAVHLEPVTDGQGQNREAGSIACGLTVAADDVPAARGAVFDLLAAWAQWLADDRKLADDTGQARLVDGWLSLAVDVALITTRGATASAVVTITYTATTYG
jgi:hypothetical protein